MYVYCVCIEREIEMELQRVEERREEKVTKKRVKLQLINEAFRSWLFKMFKKIFFLVENCLISGVADTSGIICNDYWYDNIIGIYEI